MRPERSLPGGAADRQRVPTQLVCRDGPSKDDPRQDPVYPPAVMNTESLDLATPIHSASAPPAKPNPRKENKIVEAYLAEIERKAGQPKAKSPEQLREDLASLSDQIRSAEGIEKLHLLQQRENLFAEMKMAEEGALDSMEAAFIEVASSYGERKGISYSTWREFGVPKDILEQARIKRTRRPYPIED